MTRTRDPLDVHTRIYGDLERAGVECMHGVVCGDVIRPWAASPACPHCRRHLPCWITPADAARRPVPPPAPPAAPSLFALHTLEDR